MTDTTRTVDGYVDLYLLPVPSGAMDAYRQQATTFGNAVKEHGGLAYREFRADDLGEGFGAAAGDGNVLTAAVVDFDSRAHRDEVMAKVMSDPRVEEMAEPSKDIADMSAMRYGGFWMFLRG